MADNPFLYFGIIISFIVLHSLGITQAEPEHRRKLHRDHFPANSFCYCENGTTANSYQIGKIDQNKLVMDLNPLEKLLKSSEYANKKVAIITIIGIHQTGKSGFMNMLHRYLLCSMDDDQSCEDTYDWFHCHQESQENKNNKCAFPFGTTTNPRKHTDGIWITKVPYIKNDTAIFLVDTQGLGANRDNVNELDAKITHLALTISSTLILNKNYPMDTYFTERIGTFVAQVRDMDGDFLTNNSNVRPLQNLLFAVRRYDGYADGHDPLKEFWEDSQEPKKYHQEIRQAFKTEKDCLLPSIPRNLTTMPKDRKVINAYYKCLENNFKNPEPKMVFDNYLTGKELAKYLKTAVDYLVENNRTFLDFYDYELKTVAEKASEIGWRKYQACMALEEHHLNGKDLAEWKESDIRTEHANCVENCQLVIKQKSSLLRRHFKELEAAIETFKARADGWFYQITDAKYSRDAIMTLASQNKALQDKIDNDPFNNILTKLAMGCGGVLAVYLTFVFIKCFSGFRVRNKVSSV